MVEYGKKLLTISYQKICVAFFIMVEEILNLVQEILNNTGNFGNLQILKKLIKIEKNNSNGFCNGVCNGYSVTTK